MNVHWRMIIFEEKALQPRLVNRSSPSFSTISQDLTLLDKPFKHYKNCKSYKSYVTRNHRTRARPSTNRFTIFSAKWSISRQFFFYQEAVQNSCIDFVKSQISEVISQRHKLSLLEMPEILNTSIKSIFFFRK